MRSFNGFGAEELLMKGKRNTPEQIIERLREAEAELNGGSTIDQVCQKLGVSEQAFRSWRNLYGGMKSSAAKRMKELEEENRRLKQVVADLTLYQQVLKEADDYLGNG
jgi:transposase-like protein